MYFVTVLSSPTDSRCVGYFDNLEEAIERTEENELDIQERSFRYAVIENIKENCFYPICFDKKNSVWLEWNKETERFVRIEKCPEQFSYMCNFGIG